MRKKFGKKLLSLFVALLMVVTTFPVTALSATEEEHDCAVCNGSGTIECTECENGQIDVTCSACGGSGLVTANCDACSATGYLENSCPTCAGTGLDGENQCSDCSGNGVVQIPCDNCNATGLIETTCESCNGNKVVKEDCAVCSATGEVECTTCAGTGKISREYEICPDCDGTGECNMCAGTGVLDQDCSVCNGTKIVDCEDCVAGEVRMACDVCNATGEVTVKKPCATCAATGMLDGTLCPDCNGATEIETTEDCAECENGYVISVCSNCGGTGTIDCSNCENGKEKITCTQCNGTKKCARCSGTGKIYTTQDDSFAFSDPNPQPIEVGDTYQNVATSTNNVSGEIQYSVDDDSIATVSDDGTVTALRVGTVVVTASIATDYTYSSAKISYNLSIEKGNPEISDIYATEITYGQTLADSTLSAKATLGGKNISGKIEWKNSEIKPKVNDSNKTEYDCVFTPDDQDNYNPVDCKATLNIKQASINPIITPYQGAYDKESHDALEISGILDTDTITYFVDGVQVDSMPTVKDVSDNEKEITVKIKRNENYVDFEGTYSCLITRIDIDAEIVQNPDLVYTGEEQDALTITNNSGDEITSVTYTPKELQDGELSISNDGKVKNAGVYRYEVTLVINNNYNEKVVFPVITTVAQADPELEITNDPKKTYQYEENQKIHINTEKSALTTADVTYKVDNDEVATISDTGELSILQPGNVTVTASVEETDNCKADEATITITISPGDYTPAFENGDQVTLTYGAQTEYVNALDVDSVKSSGEISYSIEPVNSELVASFDTTTGKIVFADGVQSGSLTVTANIAADEYYKAQEISYKLEVMPLETPDNAYTVDTSINDNGWIYTSPVQISAAEDYQISKQCSFAAENWSDSITFDTIDGTNEFKFYIRDSSGKITSVITESQNVDCTSPQDLTITFSETAITKVLEDIIFGFYNSKNKKLSVTLKASDATSGLEKFVYCYDGKNDIEIVPDENGECTFTIESEYKGQVKFTAYDKAGNFASFDSKNNKTVQGAINDLTSPEGTVAYSEPANSVGGLRYYSVAPELTFTIDEEYFFSTYELSDETVSTLDKNVGLNITKDGEEYYTGSAVPDEEYAELFTAELNEPAEANELGTITVTIPSVLDKKANDGVYAVKLLYSDLSGNSVEIESENFVIDTTAPVVTVSYDNDTVNENAKDDTFFNKARTATITVEEHNFNPESIDATITAKDIFGKDVKAAEAIEMLANLEWDPEGAEGDTHTATIKYSDDAWYTFALISFKDYAFNEMNPDNNNEVIYDERAVSPDAFVVDKSAPENLTIEYKTPIYQEIIEKLTFGFYQASCTVILNADDNISGVQYFEYWYDVTEDSVNPEDKGGKVDVPKDTSEDTVVDKENGKLEFTIPAQFRGKVSAVAVNNSGVGTDKLVDEENRIVVDTIAPSLAVTYESEGNASYYSGAQHSNADDFATADYVYYDATVTAQITVDEANFFEGKQKYIEENGDLKENGFIHQIGIQLEKTDNDGNVTKIEYLPQGTDKLFEDTTQTETISWKDDGTKHSFKIDYDTDADYKLIVKYVGDFSENSTVIADEATKDTSVEGENVYESKVITVDTTAPVVKVEYDSSPKAVHTIDGRSYYDANRSAIVTVIEHNFRASDFETEDLLLAKDILGHDVTNYISYFKNGKNWTTDGNIHTIKVDFVSDANYTFDFAFVDLAENACADYNADLFTVDKTAPKNLKVSYSSNVFQTIINAITFDYYDKQMTVTISADDDTTGIYHFMYSYLTADGVSDVNAQLLNDSIKRANIRLSGKTSTATFNIPKSALTNNNQFNGTVEFTAYDYAENSTYRDDSRRVIVDSISPNATISYNNPVQNVNNVSYYDGNINATIIINEANFYREDVEVIVSRNGSETHITPSWTDNSVDTHTGTFTLQGDGDYIVRVLYSDRSGNSMTEYTSNQLTIDTTDPVITVSGIKHQSANNNETIGFSISITDRNIPANGITPVLTALIRDENGQFRTITIDLGTPVVSTDSQGNTVYTYTVTNLDVDGYYSLSCTALDYANHSVSLINSEQDNGGSATEQTLNFSVNREGSVFWIETHHNYISDNTDIVDELDGKYVNGEVEITIHEVNVDQVDILDSEDQRTLFTLNDGSSTNDVNLVEGRNYTKNTSIGEGGWYETEYVLNNDNFDHDGTYSFNILSYDRAGNSNVNTKNDTGSIRFTVDRTNPIITSNVVTDQVIDADEFIVELQVNDVNPDEEKLEIVVNNVTLSGQDITGLGNNSYSFKMNSGSSQSFKVSTVDLATNNSEAYEIEGVTISTNRFVLFYYSHTILFWIIVAAILILACAIIFFIFKRRKKEDEDKEDTTGKKNN